MKGLFEGRLIRGAMQRAGGLTTAKQFVQFCLVGVLGVSIQYGTFFALHRWGRLHYLVASTAGAVVGTIVIYFINRSWTFRVRSGGVLDQSLRYLGMIVSFYAVNALCMFLLTDVAGLHPELSQIITLGVTTMHNFLLSKYWVFR